MYKAALTMCEQNVHGLCSIPSSTCSKSSLKRMRQWGNDDGAQGESREAVSEVSWCPCFVFKMSASFGMVLLCSAGHICCVFAHGSTCCSFWIFFVMVHKTGWTLGVPLRFLNAPLGICILLGIWRFLFKLSYFFMMWGSLSLSLFLVNIVLYFLPDTCCGGSF